MRRALLWPLLALSCDRVSSSDEPAADAAGADTTLADASDDYMPPPPPGLTRWVIGDPADAVVATTPGLILMGGGADIAAAFRWQRDRIAGGDVVVLRASGADGYNRYLFEDIGGVDSVETLLVPTRALAAEPYVAWTLNHAEAIFIAGGDQATYLAAWADGPVEAALAAAWQRGAVIGGTSAGCAILGSSVYSATRASVSSAEALANPYHANMTFEQAFLRYPPLAGVVTDSHLAARDRMGRLLGFVARAYADGWAPSPAGLGIDEDTAVLVDETGLATVAGAGAAYLIRPQVAPARCDAGAPLEWNGVPLVELRAGDSVRLPDGAATVASRPLSASGGALQPANPY